MSKILIYSPSSEIWGGGQIYIEQLCNYININGYTSSILTAEPESFSSHTLKMELTKTKFSRLTSAFKLALTHKRNGSKVIILNDLSSLWLAPVFRIFGFKVISLLHLYLQKKSVNALGHSNFEYHLLKISSKFCHKIFSVNKENINVFGVDKVNFIGNFVPRWFMKKDRNSKTKKYDFIIVARLAKQKNIPLFIDILAELIKRSNQQYSALIVGDGPEKQTIHEKVKNKNLINNIDYLEWIDRENLPNIFDQGKCFVISSFHEGFATTLLEAHARGLPAIVTKSAGFCAEFIENYNAITGLVFVPNDLKSDQFYIRLTELLNNYKSYRLDCIEKANVFSKDNVLGPILNAVKKLSQDNK